MEEETLPPVENCEPASAVVRRLPLETQREYRD